MSNLDIFKKDLNTIADYKEAIDEDLTFGRPDLAQKLEDLPITLNKWLKLYFDAREIKSIMEYALEELVVDLVIKIEESDDARFKGLSRKAIETKVKFMDSYRAKADILRKQEMVCEYLDETVNNIKFSYNNSLKGYIELLKLEGL